MCQPQGSTPTAPTPHPDVGSAPAGPVHTDGLARIPLDRPVPTMLLPHTWDTASGYYTSQHHWSLLRIIIYYS